MLKNIKLFCKKKNIEISVKSYLVDAMRFMALGLFASLLTGMIITTIGDKTGISWLVQFGKISMASTGSAIAVAVAYGLKAPPLTLFASIAVGSAAMASGGGPAGCFVAAVVASEFGKLVSKETKLDIIVTPAVTLISGIAVAMLIGPYIGNFMKTLGELIVFATNLHPVPMGIIVSVLMGLFLTAPVSSAAIAVMLDLNGIAAGAATVGCCSHMIGFAVMSYRENKVAGLFAQGIGTSMLQIPNIVKNPKILFPPVISSAILGPLVTTIIPLTNNAAGAGMGTSGLVGQFGTLASMGTSVDVLIKIILFQFIAPALICMVLGEVMRKYGWIGENDLKLEL